MARVSVVIPVWNGAATVGEAIQSVLDQRWRDFEVIVVNDGSTDATARVLESYGDQIKVIEQENSGPAAARNAGVRASSGEYLAFLDADDKWLPEMLSRTVPILDRDPACVLVYCNLVLADSNARELEGSLIGNDLAHAPSMEDMLARMWPIMPSGALMRRSAFERCGGFCEEFKAASYEDAHLWYLLREQGPFHYLPERLAVWRFSAFPKPLKKGGRDTESIKIFARLISERYGVDPWPVIKGRCKAPRSTLGYMGLIAMREGDRGSARRAFLYALRIDPLHLKTYLRLIRTFLPPVIARMLSGSTWRRPRADLDRSTNPNRTA
jgi:glycosyltransferase involved in cell wall biosynthesis